MRARISIRKTEHLTNQAKIEHSAFPVGWVDVHPGDVRRVQELFRHRTASLHTRQ